MEEPVSFVCAQCSAQDDAGCRRPAADGLTGLLRSVVEAGTGAFRLKSSRLKNSVPISSHLRSDSKPPHHRHPPRLKPPPELPETGQHECARDFELVLRCRSWRVSYRVVPVRSWLASSSRLRGLTLGGIRRAESSQFEPKTLQFGPRWVAVRLPTPRTELTWRAPQSLPKMPGLPEDPE